MNQVNEAAWNAAVTNEARVWLYREEGFSAKDLQDLPTKELLELYEESQRTRTRREGMTR